jgi:hypothetical protein
MDADAFPRVPKDLLEAIETQWPEKMILPEDDLPHIYSYGGQRALVKWLRQVFDAQQNQPNEETPPVDEPPVVPLFDDEA